MSSKRRKQLSVNLPMEVLQTWDETRVGYQHTHFAMAALCAYRLLDIPEQRQLMTLIGAVLEGQVPWARALEWCDQVVEQRSRHVEALVGERLRTRLGKRPKRRSERGA